MKNAQLAFRGIILPQLYAHLADTIVFDKDKWFHGKVEYELKLSDETGFTHIIKGYVPDKSIT